MVTLEFSPVCTCFCGLHSMLEQCFPTFYSWGTLSCVFSSFSCLIAAAFDECHCKVFTKVNNELNPVHLNSVASKTCRTMCFQYQGWETWNTLYEAVLEHQQIIKVCFFKMVYNTIQNFLVFVQ